MEQGLLFYGIYVPRTGFPVYQGVEGAATVHPDTTDTPFAIAYLAVMPAKVTVYLAVLTFLVERGFFHDGPSFRGSFVFSVVVH